MSKNNQYLSDLGEFGLIKKLTLKTAFKSGDFKILVPNGDDAFVLQSKQLKPWVFSTDTMVEGSHFNLSWLDGYFSKKEQAFLLGQKLLAVNLSDLASMGNVQAQFVLLTLGTNAKMSVEFAQNLYRGIKYWTKKLNITIGGGDTVSSDKIILSATLAGTLQTKKSLQRCNAKSGDVVMLSGRLGLSGAGLRILQNGLKLKNAAYKKLLMAHVLPTPQLEQGAFLSGYVNAALDTSDDLRTSLRILSEQSHCSIRVNLQDHFIDAALQNFCLDQKLDPWQFFVDGGEDYQLLFTLPQSQVSQVQKKFPKSFVIGQIQEGNPDVSFYYQDKKVNLPVRGFKHF